LRTMRCSRVSLRRLAPLSTEASKVEALCDEVCKLNVIELSQFLELFKERAGLKDSDMAMAAPMAMPLPAAAAPEAAEAAPVVEEREYWDIKLTGFDDKAKIKVIKEVRAMTGLGLKEAKEVVEGVPSVIKKEVKKDEADDVIKKLAELGAQAELE